MNTAYIVCVFMALLDVAIVTETCSCTADAPETLKEYLRSSDFAVKAMVSNWVDNDDRFDSTFNLRINQTFKMPSRYVTETKVKVHSHASRSSCSLGYFIRSSLESRVETGPFFVTANVRKGQLWTTFCSNTINEWKWLSGSDRATILNFPHLNVGIRGSGEGGYLQVVTSTIAVTLLTVNGIFDF